MYRHENLYKMQSIDKRLIKIVDSESKKFKNDLKANDYVKADKEFEELVKKGVAKKRGYNLMSVEDFPSKSYSINSRNR